MLMPRLRPVPKSEVTDSLTLSIYERLFDGRDPVAQPGTATGTPGDWWTVLAQAPHVLEHFVLASRMYLGEKVTLSPQLRELGQTRAGWLNGSQFVYSQHCKMARGAGLTAAQVEGIAAWQVADCFDERQRTVLAYIDYLIGQRGRVPDAVFAKLKTYLSDVEIVELTYVTCCYDGYSVLTRALRLEFDDRDDPVIAPATYGGQDFMGADKPS
jgi:alkylhydroperoxidase family enzyme